VLAALAVVLGQIEQHDRHAGVDAVGGDLRAHDPGAAHRHAADEQGGGLAGLHDIVSSLVLMSCPIFRLSLICAENSNDRLNLKMSPLIMARLPRLYAPRIPQLVEARLARPLAPADAP